VREPISIFANADAHIWRDTDGTELDASAILGVTLPSGSLIWLVPWDDTTLSLSAVMGKFLSGRNVYRGIKATIFGYSVFIDSDLNLHWRGSEFQQVLTQTGSRSAALVTRVGANQIVSQRVEAQRLAAPLADRALQSSLTVSINTTVSPGQTDALFDLAWRQGTPHLALRAPDGTIYDSERPDPKVFTVHLGGPAKVRGPQGYTGAVSMLFPHPQAGIWTVDLTNVGTNDGYNLTVHVANPQPTVDFSTPGADRIETATPNAPLAKLEGTVTVPSSSLTSLGAASVSLYYTTEPTVVITNSVILTETVPISNYAGTAIAAEVRLQHEGATPGNLVWKYEYEWNTSAVPPGEYSVYAVLNDGMDAAVMGYAAGKIRVLPSKPAPPRNILATSDGQDLHIFWTPPENSPLLAGYRLFWSTSDMPGTTYTLDVGDEQSYTLEEARQGVTYTIEVASINDTGQVSDPQLVTVVPKAQAGAPFHLSDGSGETVPGGEVIVPLTFTTTGSQEGRTSDYVTLSVSDLPPGVSMEPTILAVDLFAHVRQGDPNAPALRLLVSDNVAPTPPGQADVFHVTARQDATGYSQTATVALTIAVGSAAHVGLWYGAPVAAPDGLLRVHVVAKVFDASGLGADEGTGVSFDATQGMITTPRIQTTLNTANCVSMPASFCGPNATVPGGFAATDLLYAPGTTPYVSADIGTDVANVYVGPTPGQASRTRTFAIHETPRTQAGNAREFLRLTNGLDLAAHIQVHYWTTVSQPRLGNAAGILEPPLETVESVVVNPHSTSQLPLDPVSRAALGNEVFEGPDRTLGLQLTSDLPVTSTYVLSGTGVLATNPGLEDLKQQYAFAMPGLNASLSLFSRAPSRITVTATVTAGGLHRQATTTVPLGANQAAHIAIASLFTFTTVRIAPTSIIHITLSGDQPFAAQVPPTSARSGAGG
jgi:hypothetical protein